MSKPATSTNSSFRRDLQLGKFFEDACLKGLKDLGHEPEESPKGSYWDLSLKNFQGKEESKAEVKFDLRALDTGNLAFETSYRGNNSGVLKDEHDFWFHIVHPLIYVFDSKELRKSLTSLFESGKVKFMPYLGDGSSGYLMPKALIEEGIVKPIKIYNIGFKLEDTQEENSDGNN